MISFLAALLLSTTPAPPHQQVIASGDCRAFGTYDARKRRYLYSAEASAPGIVCVLN
jgi:hypothetical protein